jgi:peptidoglycan/LPS O-acetylase OafA/YrhL
VVVAHSSEFLYRLKNNPTIGNSLQILLKHLEPFGQLGVELFFALSGFLIGTILIKQYMQVERLEFKELLHFWKRRWWRTLPLYWVAVTINIVMYHAIKLQPFEAWKLTYYPLVQNLAWPHPPFFMGEAWSLAIEEWFYLTFPIALWVFAKRSNDTKQRQKNFLYITLFYALSAIILRSINALQPIYTEGQDSGIRKVVLLRLDAITLGVLIAYLHYFHGEWLAKWRKALLGLGVLITCFVYYLILFPAIATTAAAGSLPRYLGDAFLYLLAPLGFALCIPYFSSIRTHSSNIAVKVITQISTLSYALYLCHYSMIYIPYFYRLQCTTTIEVVGIYSLYLLLITLVAWGLHKLIEQPFMRYRDRTTF